MRLLFVADGRSPIARNWIEYFLERGDEVHLVSTFPGQADPRLASYQFLPLAFSGLKSRPWKAGEGHARLSSGVWRPSAVGWRTRLRHWFGPFTLFAAARRLRQHLDEVRPQLIHAMRLPFEGMLAALARPAAPLLLSVWGNDFTLHAPSTPLMRHFTRLSLRRADALHTDCQRDVRLAQAWGFPEGRLAFVLPGGGGVQPELFYPPADVVTQPRLVQPRGVRAYVQNRLFFEAVRLVLAEQPRLRVFCPSMAGVAEIEGWVERWGLRQSVSLLPPLSRPQMAELFRGARVMVSPTTHDGTPNTLLEAMACGCLPLAGDLESLREWIVPGENGLLVPLQRPDDLAQAMLRALQDDDFCRRARAINLRLIAQRAAYPTVMAQAARYYEALLRTF